MEKRAAHYDLNAIKDRVAASGMDVFTRTARETPDRWAWMQRRL